MHLFVVNVMIIFSAQKRAADIPRIIVMDVNVNVQTYAPCSRNFPVGVSGFWTPTKSDVQEIDDSVDLFLRRDIYSPELPGKPPISFGMQLLGVLIGSDSLVYINGFPSYYMPESNGLRKTRMVNVCDGGQEFWGALWDRNRKLITNLEFNGKI